MTLTSIGRGPSLNSLRLVQHKTGGLSNILRSDGPLTLKGIRRNVNYTSMNRILCLFLAFSACAIADEQADRAAIDRTIVSLSERLADSNTISAAQLFTADAKPAEREGLFNLHRQLLAMSSLPWSELTPPVITSNDIRFFYPDIALVDAALSQTGVATHGIPLLFVMMRQGTNFRFVLGSLAYDASQTPRNASVTHFHTLLSLHIQHLRSSNAVFRVELSAKLCTKRPAQAGKG